MIVRIEEVEREREWEKKWNNSHSNIETDGEAPEFVEREFDKKVNDSFGFSRVWR